jgi:hypothetical protein
MLEPGRTLRQFGRREFVKTLAVLPAYEVLSAMGNPAGLAHAAGVAGKFTPITDVFMDLHNIHKWDQSNGDTWDPFWADDDNLYAFNCDGRGFGTQQRNLSFNRLQGDAPHKLVGTSVNSMDEYGVANKKETDNATWKACGQECIDSIFYAFVSRNVYGSDSHDPLLRQTAFNSSLIKSTDRGLTWTRSAAENYRNPMWPGPRFGAPFFVHYGRNGGKVTQDHAHRYVYAISTNGFWNDGDNYIIGRIERAKLPNLQAPDWTYYAGGDGEDPNNWGAQVDKAEPILSLPARCGQSPACFIPSLGVYLMISWYNPAKMTKWFEPNVMKYDFYQSPHPWGPWTFIRSYSDRFISTGHMYGPSLCARFQERKGSEVRMTLFTSGCPFEDQPSGLYKMWAIPIVLRISPMPISTLVNDDDARISYIGNWRALTKRGFYDEHDDVHYTTSPGDSVQFEFSGTGIEVVAEKSPDLGDIDVYLDGVLKANVSLRLVNFPRLSRVVVFSAEGLSNNRHTIKIENKSKAGAMFDAFRVYGGVAQTSRQPAHARF